MATDSLDISLYLQHPDAEAAEVWNTWALWNQSRDGFKKIVNEVSQYIEATDTKGTTNVDGDFNHTTNRPKIAQIYDNLTANYKPGLMPTKDWFKWEGADKDSVKVNNRKLLEGFLKTKHRVSGFSKTVDLLLDDWIRTGNCFAGVEYVNNFYQDKKKPKFTRGYKGPKTFRIDPFDIVFNPTATDWEHTPKVIRSRWGIGDLMRKAKTIGQPHREKYELILDKLKESRANIVKNPTMEISGPGFEEAEKYYQLTWSGFGNYTQYLKSGMVEVLEFYGDMYNSATGEWEPDRHIVVVDRRWVILNEPCPTWNGKPHIYHCAWRTRRNNIWGMGPLEGILGLQYRINHLENLKADAFDGMVDADEVLIGNVEITWTETGAKQYEVAESDGDVKKLPPATEILTADMQIDRIELAMDLYAGSPREAAGFRTPGEKTKFEVSQLINAAGRIFQHKLEKFEEYLIEPVLNAEIEVTRQAAEYSDTIEMIDPDNGTKMFNDITADDLYMNGAYVPIGARHYSRQQQLAQDARDMMQVVIQDQGILQHLPGDKLAKLFTELMGFEDHDLYVKFGRVHEQAEAARVMREQQRLLEEEDDIDLQEPTEEELANETGFEEPTQDIPESV